MKSGKIVRRSLASMKTKLAFRFLRAIKKLNNNKPYSPPNKYKKYHAIRAAAYSSMASAVGPHKAWSRAVLTKIRHHKLQLKERKTRHHHARKTRENPRINDLGFGHENDLRKLVPGGQDMDFCRLLKETGHFIKCLRAQVQVMRKIVDYSSRS